MPKEAHQQTTDTNPEVTKLTEEELQDAQGGLLLPAVQKSKHAGPSELMALDKNKDGKIAH